MTLKSPFYRAAILFPLFLSLAGVASSSPSGQSGGGGLQQERVSREVGQQVYRQAIMDSQSTPDKSSPTISPEQRRKSNFENMKRDVDELADLVKALQEELKKANENILSRGIVDKADKIGKLAKKIKGSARGS